MKSLKKIFVFLLGSLATVYLSNLSAGIIEFIPDNAPIVGNIDEAFAAVLLVNALNYFGFKLPMQPINLVNK